MKITVKITEHYQGNGNDGRDTMRVVSEDESTEYPICLNNGDAAAYYAQAEVVEEDLDYQGWIDGQDWDGCPSEDGSDYEANCAWAEDRARARGEWIVQALNSSELLLVKLIND